MTIEVPAEVVNATYDRVLNRLASKAKIEGFRPGKAPRALIESRIGPAALREEVVETMVPEVVRQALDEKSIDPIDNPDVEVLELERGKPAKLKATISVMPEVTLADVTTLKVEPRRPDTSPTAARPDQPTRSRRYTPQGAPVKLYAALISLIAANETRLREEKGATAVEYGLMVGLIAVVIIGAVTLLGTQLQGLFNSIAGALP